MMMNTYDRRARPRPTPDRRRNARKPTTPLDYALGLGTVFLILLLV